MSSRQYSLDMGLEETPSDNLYNKANKVLKALQVEFPVNIPVELIVSSRMVSTLGRAEVEYVNNKKQCARLILSAYLGDDWEDTLRHEYAHIMAGRGSHNKKWRDSCVLLGIEPVICGNMPDEDKRLKHVYTCACRNHYRAIAIKPDVLKRVYCKDCKQPLKYSNAHKKHSQATLDIN